jgi:hypothetical protein
MKLLKILFYLLFGKTPTLLQYFLTLAMALLGGGVLYFYSNNDIGLAISAFDICGGIVTNSCKSTRKYWASLPFFVVPLFLIIHVLEIPYLWQETEGQWFFWLLIVAMMAKLSVFILGQEEYRRSV